MFYVGENMVVAAILAGGSGMRMGAASPKQFLQLGNEPILVHSARAFLHHEKVEKVCIVVPQNFMEQTQSLLHEFIDEANDIAVIAGGKNRSLSLLQAVRYFGAFCPPDTCILTHDAVRPFVTERMIDENIQAVQKYSAVGTAVPAVDTLLLSSDGLFIASVPPRKTAFHAQTPQSFVLGMLSDLLEQASDEQHENFTDGCSVFLQAGLPVAMVRGEAYNIKITYPDDLVRGENILKNHFN